MFSIIYQKVSATVRQWFEFARFPADPVLIPIKVRLDESRRHLPYKRK